MMDAAKRARVAGVIPARLGSTRLHEKVLRLISGRPMIEWVWKQASKAKELDELWVACDDQRIFDCVKAFGGQAVMTSPAHPNGSSRVAEVAGQSEADIFINIQGDEPLMDPASIDLLAAALRKDPALQVATLAVRKTSREDYESPNVVKVVSDSQGCALYFSRSPIPYFRETPGTGFSYFKHLGIYGYRKDFLLHFVKWPVSTLENIEKLEQLRILEMGVRIAVIEAAHDAVSVDTAEDLALVEEKLRALLSK